eukprot:m.163104 g.163104  ORF g.163104 m.163104 type:complete len:320 (+) comp21025_c0_seq4:1452-2411(+)
MFSRFFCVWSWEELTRSITLCLSAPFFSCWYCSAYLTLSFPLCRRVFLLVSFLHRPCSAHFCLFLSQVYLSMLLLRGWNKSLSLVTLKLLLLFPLSAVFWWEHSGTRPFFDAFFSLPGFFQLFQEKGSIREWYFRSALDRYAWCFGMLVSFAAIQLQSRWKSSTSLYTAGAVVAAALVVVGYVFFSAHCGSKPECNAVHPWSSLLLLLAYVVLRNSVPLLRNTYSPWMARAGQMSLELFLGQYHMWLAWDTKGLLVLLPGFPLLNFVLTSGVFLLCVQVLWRSLGVVCDFLLAEDGKSPRLALFLGGVGVAWCVAQLEL